MAGIDFSALVDQIHSQNSEIAREVIEQKLDNINRTFIAKVDNLIAGIKNITQLNSTIMEKMQSAQFLDENNYNKTRAGIKSIINNEKGIEAFKQLNMLVIQYQQELAALQGKTIETQVVISFQNTIKIVTLTEDLSDSSDEGLIKAFDNIFRIDRASRGGGLSARYITSNRALENKKNIHNIEVINNLTKLETAYFEILRRAKITKTGDKDKGGLKSSPVIPVKINNKITYYRLSSLGDMKEAYLNMHLNNQNLNDIEDPEQCIKLLLDASIKNVTNTSGLLEGDIKVKDVKKDDLQLEVAAKSDQASAMGILQAIDFAYQMKALVSSGGSRGSILSNDEVKNLALKKGGKNVKQQGDAIITYDQIKAAIEKEIFGSL